MTQQEDELASGLASAVIIAKIRAWGEGPIFIMVIDDKATKLSTSTAAKSSSRRATPMIEKRQYC